MKNKQIIGGLLVLAVGFIGCSQCQDCYDYTGPVPGSPNQTYYERSGSALSGAQAPVVTEHGSPTVITPMPGQ